MPPSAALRAIFSAYMNNRTRIEVYTDGECPLCQWMRAKVEPFDRQHRIDWMNYRDPEVLSRAAPHTFQELNEEMHARTPDGRCRIGRDNAERSVVRDGAEHGVFVDHDVTMLAQNVLARSSLRRSRVPALEL